VALTASRRSHDLSVFVDEREIRAIIGPNALEKRRSSISSRAELPPLQEGFAFKESSSRSFTEYQIVRAGLGRKFQTPSVYESLTVFETWRCPFRTIGAVGHMAVPTEPDVGREGDEESRSSSTSRIARRSRGILGHGQNSGSRSAHFSSKPELVLLDEPVAE